MVAVVSILDTIDRPHRGKRKAQVRLTPAERIARSSEHLSNGCVVWTGTITNAGYGSFMVTQVGYPTVNISAHRAAWELRHGRIPKGLVIDHLCRNRPCVNTDHMELVTQRENVMRSPVTLGAVNAAKTHCAKGHEYSPENTYIYKSSSPRTTTMRVCRTCQREYVRRYRLRGPAEANGAGR